MEPFAEQDHLAGDCGDVIPGKQAEQCQVELREGVHPGHAAHSERLLACSQQSGIGHWDPGEFEGEIGFDRGVNLRGTAVVDVPSAIGELEGEKVMNGFALPPGVDLAVPMMVGEHVGDESAIDHQFAQPVAFWSAQLEQMFLGTPDGSDQVTSSG